MVNDLAARFVILLIVPAVCQVCTSTFLITENAEVNTPPI